MLRSCGDGAALSSLGLLRKSREQTTIRRCPRRYGMFCVGQSTGRVIPARCGAAFCPWCGPLNAIEVAGAIGLTEPERFIVMTGLAPTFHETQWRLKEVVDDVRAEGFDFEYVLHIEWNPKETGYHGNLYQRGSYVPQRFLQCVCQSHGFGIPYIEAFRARGGAGEAYGLKLAGLDYGMKLAQRQQSLERFLEVNGGRLSHQSRRFFRNGSGEPCGLTEGRRAWRDLVAGDPEVWQVVCHPEWEEEYV